MASGGSVIMASQCSNVAAAYGGRQMAIIRVAAAAAVNGAA